MWSSNVLYYKLYFQIKVFILTVLSEVFFKFRKFHRAIKALKFTIHKTGDVMNQTPASMYDLFWAKPTLSFRCWVKTLQFFQAPVRFYQYLWVPVYFYRYLQVPLHFFRYLQTPVHIYRYLQVPVHFYRYLQVPVHFYRYTYRYPYIFIDTCSLSIPVGTGAFLSLPVGNRYISIRLRQV